MASWRDVLRKRLEDFVEATDQFLACDLSDYERVATTEPDMEGTDDLLFTTPQGRDYSRLSRSREDSTQLFLQPDILGGDRSTASFTEEDGTKEFLSTLRILITRLREDALTMLDRLNAREESALRFMFEQTKYYRGIVRMLGDDIMSNPESREALEALVEQSMNPPRGGNVRHRGSSPGRRL